MTVWRDEKVVGWGLACRRGEAGEDNGGNVVTVDDVEGRWIERWIVRMES